MEIRVDKQKRKQSEEWGNIKFISNILTNVKGSDKNNSINKRIINNIK